jgi:hypothetical protein
LENRHRNLSQDNSDLDEMIVFGRYFIQRLDRLYLESNLAMKQQLIVLMFPEKLKFEKGSLQTIAITPSSLS